MIRTFSASRVDSLEDTVNSWISYNDDFIIKEITFKVGVKDGEEIHYAYVWYEKDE